MLTSRILAGCCTALLAATHLCPAQTLNTVRFAPPAGQARAYGQLLSAPGGNWWAPSMLRWGSDSMQLSLLHLRPNLTIRYSRQARLTAIRGSYSLYATTARALFTGGRATAGSGGQTGQHVFSFDTTLARRWGVRFTNTLGGGGNFYSLLTQGDDTLTAYMSRSSQGGPSFYRIWGDAATGSRWRGRLITAPGGISTLLNEAVAHGPRNTHYVVGGRGDGGIIIKLDTTKAYWGRRLVYGGNDDGVTNVVPARNGDLWLLFETQQSTNPDEVILCRMDTAGNLLSSRRLAMAGRYLKLNTLLELPTGEVVLAGAARLGPGGNSHPMLIKLAANGALAWARRWDLGSGSDNLAPGVKFIRRAGGYSLVASDLSVVDLDANFSACRFDDEPAGSVTVAPATLTVTPFTATMEPFQPAFVAETLVPRSFSFTRSLVCTTVGIDEEAAAAAMALQAWPQPLPRGAALHLALPVGWNTVETHLTLTSALGQVVWRGPWTESVALPTTLPASVWTLTLTGKPGQVLRRQLMTE